MKKAILTLLSGVIMPALHAQISVLPEAGFTIAKMSSWSRNAQGVRVDHESEPVFAFRGGVSIDFQFASGVFFQPGVFYNQKGSKLTLSGADIGSTIKTADRLHYLEVPLTFGYRYSFGRYGKIFAGAGPYLAYALAGKEKAELWYGTQRAYMQEQSITFGEGNDKMMRAIDAGLNFSIGYELPQGLFIRGQYSYGFTDINKSFSSMMHQRNRAWGISLGYTIRF